MESPSRQLKIVLPLYGARPRRRLWHRLLRWLVGLSLLAAVGYVSLPWWLPLEAARKCLCEQMSRQMGVPVTMEHLSVSWSDGVEITNFRLASPEPFGPEPLVQVRRLRADFSPLTYLMDRKLDWMEVDQARLSVQFDAQGNSNLSILSRLQSDVATHRISVHQADLALQLPQQTRRLHVAVADMQVLGGRLQRLGRVTMSAALEQPDRAAPISLRLLAERGQPTAADATLGFTNIQLEPLRLSGLLKLPIAHLGGSCSGNLNLKVNSRGVVDQFDLNVRLRQLAIQPTQGPHLPTIDRIDLSVVASLDPLTDRIDLKNAHISMPGLDLTGKAMLLADMSGILESIQFVQLSGQADPAALASIVGGLWRQVLWPIGQCLPPGTDPVAAPALTTQGPLTVDFLARRDGSAIVIQARADAGAIQLRQGGRLLKAAGTELVAQFQGKLDWHDWDLVIDRAALKLGTNELESRGKIINVQRLIDDLTAEPSVAMEQWRRELGSLELAGMGELRDVGMLRQALPELDELLGTVRIAGPLQGRFSIEQSAGTRVHAGLAAPAGTELTVGDFRKPPSVPMDSQVSARIDPQALALRDFELDVSLGEANFHSARTCLCSQPPTSASTDGGAPAPSGFQAAGDWSVTNPQVFLAAMARWKNQVRLHGSAKGTYVLSIQGDACQAKLMADVGALAIEAGQILNKPASQAAELQIDLRQSGPVKTQSGQAAMRISSPMLTVNAALGYRGRWDSGGQELEIKADIADARSLAATCPVLGRQFRAGGLSGKANLKAHLARQNGQIEGEASLEAAALELATPRDNRKSAGVPLSVELQGNIRPGPKTTELGLNRLAIKLGQNTLDYHGRLELTLPPDSQAPPEQWLRQVLEAPTHVEGDFALRCRVEAAMLELLPPLRDLAGRHGLCGGAGLSGSVSQRQGQIEIRCQVLADELGIAQAGWLAKPINLPARLSVQAVLAEDLSKLSGSPRTLPVAPGVHLENLSLTAGPCGLLADAWVTLSGDKPLSLARLAEAQLASAHVSVWSTDAAKLPLLAPRLKDYQPTGTIHADLELLDNGRSLPLVELHAGDLNAQLAGKTVTVSGDLRAEGLTAGSDWKVGLVKTTALELRAGQNRLWLTADLKDLPSQPTGAVQVLAEYLDDRDISDYVSAVRAWAGPARVPGPATSAPAGAHAATTASRPAKTPLQQADDRLADLRSMFGQAQVDLGVDVDRLKRYDSVVRQTYDVRNLQLDAGVSRGVVRVEYHAGVCGGMVQTRVRINLCDQAPTLQDETQITDVLATPVIRPQIELFFPGNIVSGLFSRDQRTSVPLREAMANSIDPAWPLRPLGTAVTVTTDGYVEGRGAPPFVTRIFPGLNLTRYKYNTMTGFAEYKADGSADNDMIFSGQHYDMYIEGVTDPHHWGQYDIGLALGGSAQWNHTWKQGRIPLLKFKARIEDGRFYDEEVSYPWPNETLFKIFLENNIVYRMWVNRQKQEAH